MEEHFGGVQDSNSPCQFLADVFCIYLDLFKKSRLLIFCRTPFFSLLAVVSCFTLSHDCVWKYELNVGNQI